MSPQPAPQRPQRFDLEPNFRALTAHNENAEGQAAPAESERDEETLEPHWIPTISAGTD